MNKQLLFFAVGVSAVVHIAMILTGEFDLLFSGWLMIVQLVWSWLTLGIALLAGYYLGRHIHHTVRPEVSE